MKEEYSLDALLKEQNKTCLIKLHKDSGQLTEFV